MTGTNDIESRLVHVFGREPGRKLYEETLAALGMDGLQSPDDEMRFADALVVGGGLMEAIGRSLRVRALLRGAARSA